MSWRLYRPRRIGSYEARIVRRVMEVGASSPLAQTLLSSIESLIVWEEGDGQFHHDSLDFGTHAKRKRNEFLLSGGRLETLGDRPRGSFTKATAQAAACLRAHR
jgi:hypothetical protein